MIGYTSFGYTLSDSIHLNLEFHVTTVKHEYFSFDAVGLPVCVDWTVQSHLNRII
jgi:hypothetical protein